MTTLHRFFPTILAATIAVLAGITIPTLTVSSENRPAAQLLQPSAAELSASDRTDETGHQLTATELPEAPPQWTVCLHEQLQDIDRRFEGELGVYVKDLESGHVVSLRGDEYWYLASGIKVPVAIIVMQNIEDGNFTLDTPILLRNTDYVDGAGQTNWSPPGTVFPVHTLLEQMLTVSDNTATDILIRHVGIEKINRLVDDSIPNGFGVITTLADVRRHAYSHFHNDAFNLSGQDFIKLRQQTNEGERIETLAAILGLPLGIFSDTNMDNAFDAYYSSRLNSGQLSAFGDMLEMLATGTFLDQERTSYLINVLSRIKTGSNRITAGIPEDVTFAHKTGTQHSRACDMGITGKPGEKRVIIAACTRGNVPTALAEQALRETGEAVYTSGVLSPVPL